ncbi:MAG TPA: MDR family MFS transporter [Rubrobacteraceae bacterium]|nr:MDR family MFS transporter [Rubrobacteraceae bacterium]
MGYNGSRKNVIFVGLMLGMLVAAVSQTIVSPAMPVIVSELGGIEHYSWIATSALLVSAVTVPVIGKLSDVYGRRGFYIAGLVVFMLGSILAGAAQGFWWLVAARAIQGFGMGTIMPLSQTIIGDIISARERGRYMGYIGAVFGVASIAGPLAGGWITDNFSWRWLFYVNLPFGVAALAFILAYLHIPHVPRRHKLDYAGFVALPIALVAVLLATTWGGTTYPWASWQIVSLYAAGVVILMGFLVNEYFVAEPVLPLRLWKNSVFTLSNVSNMAIAMTMFGAIFFIPVYAQGVIGVNVTNSGAVLIPLTASMIVVSIAVGRLITRTGRYKGFMLAGLLVMAGGYFLLTRLEYGSTQTDLTLDLIVVGLGLGAVLQTYTLVVQNATSRGDLGVATSTTQLSRSLGATLGTAVFGTIMTNGMRTEIPKHLPAQALRGPQAAELSDGSGVGAVLDPNTLGQLPDAVATGIREGLAAAMHPVFVAGLPIITIAFVATLFIKELPLRTIAFAEMEREAPAPASATSNGTEALLRAGLSIAYLSRLVESRRWSSPELLRNAAELVEPNGEVSVRERALRANEEVLKPLSRDLLTSYLRQSRKFHPERERTSEVWQ